MAALVHVNWAEAEAKDVELTCLSWALSVALAINQLLIFTTLWLINNIWGHAGAIMVDVVVRADGSAHIAFSNNKRRRALRVPLVFALLAIMALLVLTISSP